MDGMQAVTIDTFMATDVHADGVTANHVRSWGVEW